MKKSVVRHDVSTAEKVWDLAKSLGITAKEGDEVVMPKIREMKIRDIEAKSKREEESQFS